MIFCRSTSLIAHPEPQVGPRGAIETLYTLLIAQIVISSLEKLYLLGALDADGNITDLGTLYCLRLLHIT